MPTLRFPTEQTAPALPDAFELAIFPIAVVPYALGALEARVTQYTWEASSYLRGNQLIRSLQLAIILGGLKEITERQDALYRLMDTALFGTTYSVIETTPTLIVEPEIPPTHDLAIADPDSLLGRAEDMRQLLQNALNGTTTPLYDRALGVRDLLELIQTVLVEDESLDPAILAKLGEIAELLT